MARRDIVEYGEQLWAHTRGTVEFYDESREQWLRWYPDHYETMPPPSFFEKRRGDLLERVGNTRMIRLSFKVFLITSAVWLPLLLLHIPAIQEWWLESETTTTLVIMAQSVVYVAWFVSLATVIATVAATLARYLGEVALFEEQRF